MILQIFGLIAVFVVTKFVFKTARDNGRNAGRWALLNFGVGIGTQFILPIIIGMILGVYLILTGVEPDSLAEVVGDWALSVTIVCFAISFVSMFLILRQVAQVPEEPADVNIPPPPPTFNGSE